jgi:hypothetical protein
MYAPDSKVLTPDTPPTPIRGRSTQNRESFAARLAAPRSSLTVTRIRGSSGTSSTLLILPTGTFL